MRHFVSLVSLATLAACVPAASPPPAPPSPAPATRPVAALPAPVPLPTDWRDWPVTPGTWTYRGDAGGSLARFGQPDTAPVLSLRCRAGEHRLDLAVPGGTPANATIRTSSVTRTVVMRTAAGMPGSVVVDIAANDPLLDAIAFSRGHFTIEQAGRPPLVVPAWPEIGRAIEDCRG